MDSVQSTASDFKQSVASVQAPKTASPLHARAGEMISKSHAGVRPAGPRKGPTKSRPSTPATQTAAAGTYIQKAMPGCTASGSGCGCAPATVDGGDGGNGGAQGDSE